MKLAGALGLLAVLAALVAPAAAQTPLDSFTGLSVTVTPPGKALAPGKATALNVTVTAGCALVLANAQAPKATLAVSGLPAGINATAGEATFDPQQCSVPAGTVNSAPTTLSVTPGRSARGLSTMSFNVTASMPGAQGTTESTPTTVSFTVDYRACHLIRPDITFPAKVTGATREFNVTVEFCANARTMVMFINPDADSGGQVSGLAPRTEMPPKTVRIPVVFTAPTTTWTTSNVTFLNYSHYLPETGTAGDPMLQQNVTWVFTNANPEGHPAEDHDSFSLPMPMILAVLVATALVAERRRK